MDIAELIKTSESLKSSRSNLDSHLSEVERRIKPATSGFSHKSTAYSKQREYIYDSTAVLALQKSANILTSFAAPERTQYHTLASQDDDLLDDVMIQQYLNEKNKMLFRLRYSASSGFTNAITEYFQEIQAFGNAVIFTEERLAKGIRYESCDFANCWFVKGSDGVEIISREKQMTAQSIMNRFPDSVDEKLLKIAKDSPSQMFTVVHCVKESRDNKDKFKFNGYYFCPELKKVLETGGFYTMPYMVGTANRWAGENYGRGAAMMVLPDIKQVNQMTREYINGVQMSFQPPLLLTDDGVLGGFNMVAGALNAGMLDDSGRPRVAALNTGANPSIAEYGIEKSRTVINDAFLITLFQVLVDAPNMTATEVLERTRERGYLIGPIISQFNSDIMSYVVERELDVYSRAGQMDDMPEMLQRRGGGVKIEYTSELLKAQDLGDVVNFTKMLQAVAPLLQSNPKLLETEIDTGKAFRKIAAAFGQIDVFRTEEEAQEITGQVAQTEQAQQLLGALPAITDSANNLAQAQTQLQGAA